MQAASEANVAGYDLNSFKGLFALLLVHTIGPQTIVILPALVQGYVGQLGMSERDAGFLASMETWGMFVAALAMMVLMSRVNWRTLIRVSLIAMVAANLLSIFTGNAVALSVLRFAAGLGGGAIVALSYAMIGLTSARNRNFGWAVFFVLLYGAIVFPVLPVIYTQFGLAGAFFFFAVFSSLGLPFVGGLPKRGSAPPEGEADAVNLSGAMKGLAVLTMLLYFIAQIGVWSYFYRFGIRYGISEQDVGSALSLSQFFGLAGAFFVVLLARIARKDLALLAGIGLSIVSVAFLFGTHAFLAFVLISGAYQFLWNMTHPYLLGALAAFDPSGRVVVQGAAMQFLGIAAGPAIAALLVTDASLSNVLWMGMGFMAAALACVLPPVITERRMRAAGANRQPANDMA